MLPFTIEHFLAVFAACKAAVWSAVVARGGVARERRIEFARRGAVLAAAGAARIRPAR